MHYRSLFAALGVATLGLATGLATLAPSIAGAEILDYAKYPNLKGQWNRFIVRGVPGQPSFDQTSREDWLRRRR